MIESQYAIYWPPIVFAFGLLVGSFLNVCIYRLPHGRSIVLPPSACTHCGQPLPWWQNVPVVSYLVLGARCWFCAIPISARYPLVELATASLLTVVYQRTWAAGLGGPLFWYGAVFTGILIVVFFIDWDYWLILDEVTTPALVAGLVGSALLGAGARLPFHDPLGLGVPLVGPLGPSWRWAWELMQSAMGAAAGYLLFAGIRAVGSAIARQEAMGGGDLKFAAVIGAFLGWERALVGFFLAFLVGALATLPLLLIRRKGGKDPIPFGTFMALGAFAAFCWGDWLLDLYVNWPARLFHL